ncbi:MAG: hypothetical protein HYU71_11405 [Bacteroidetes bacterium]|nr:hypothetical protein [Bacteroidota bacterium]
MSKIEKSLEINITHELLSLADSFWWFLQPVSLKRYWRPHWRFPLMQTPTAVASGLPISLEGKPGGGYDICIHSSPNFIGGNPRLLFMQFKAGVHKDYNTNSKSIFYGTTTTKNAHVEFDVNSNKKRDQHRLLKTLATSAGNGNAVVYVFPRIVDEKQIQQFSGKLLARTTFISISDIDIKAAKNGITIDDGNPHKFRTCYNDYDRNEMNLLLLLLGKQPDPGGFIGEVFAIRMYRAFHALRQSLLDDFPLSKTHIMDAVIRHVLNIARHFEISLSVMIEAFAPYDQFSDRLNYVYEYDNIPGVYYTEQKNNQYLAGVFNDIMTAFSKYLYWIEEMQFVDLENIPIPPSNYSINLSNNGINFKVQVDNTDLDFSSEDLEQITYTLL